MEELIINSLKSAGFDLIGFFDNDFSDYRDFYIESNNPFIKGSLSDKTDMKKLMPEALGTIAVGITYSKLHPVINQQELHFGSNSWGVDYHRVIKDKVAKAMFDVKSQFPQTKYLCLVDNSVLDDRYIAYKAGLGFYGKNKLLINPKLGSYFFIGVILVNHKLKSSKMIENQCGSCNKCIKTCPGQALNNRHLEYQKCRSYLLQQKVPLSKDEINILGKCVFGCDTCALVCPFNKQNHIHQVAFLPTGIEQINAEIKLSNSDFKKKYGHLAGAFIGKKRLNRNIKYIKDKNNVL